MSDEQKLSLHEVVKKLVGPIRPVGETNADDVRFENLQVMVSLVNALICDIDRLVSLRDKPEHSIARAGIYANKFFNDLGIQE